jgi:hypothetical protein
MTNTQTKQLLHKLLLFRTKYENTGVILTKLLKDYDMHFLFFSQNREEFYKAELKRKFGTLNSKGQLHYELDKEVDGILTRLKKDFPYFTKEDIAIFCYSAAGFPDNVIARFANISSNKRVSTRRSQLKEIMKNSDRDRREIYLAMLLKKDKELAALADDKGWRNQDLL